MRLILKYILILILSVYLDVFSLNGSNRYTLTMRVLLDTNIIIHREASRIINPKIGSLFQWLDKLHYTKCIHPLTLEEIEKNIDKNTVETFTIKLDNYNLLKTEAPLNEKVNTICSRIDVNPNDINDTRLLNEVFCDRVNILISEDKKIHHKSEKLGIADKVYSIETFLKMVTSENPDLIDYKVLSVKKELFGNMNLKDIFFDSFREDYHGFDKWFNKRADDIAYVCYANNTLSAFLFVKVENENENYSDISPIFKNKKRLKIGTLKVASTGVRLGERFLKIVFDNARINKVDEIYVTIFDKRPEQLILIDLLQEWGFAYYGVKNSKSGEEKVFVKDFTKQSNLENPKLTYPYLSPTSDVYFVPIHPEYHTELFPDSILKTESPTDFIENEPHRNAISKSYISHSHFRNLKPGDLILFYRTGGYYEGVATTIGIVEKVITDIKDANELIEISKKRTVFKNEQLISIWNRYGTLKPFVVNFLYAYSFKRRPNLKELHQLGIIKDIKDMPRGFHKMERDLFNKLVKVAGV